MPKWPGDHSEKHAAAARKGWVTRRRGEQKAASEARPLKPRAGTAGARFNPHDTTSAQATRQLVSLYGVRQLPTALNGYSREHLADVARNLGIPHTGTKPELVARITRHMAGERAGAKSAPAKPRAAAKGGMTYAQWKAIYEDYARTGVARYDMFNHVAKHSQFAARYKRERTKPTAPARPRELRVVGSAEGIAYDPAGRVSDRVPAMRALYGDRQLATALRRFDANRLRTAARDYGLSAGGTKEELVHRITRHVTKSGK